MRNLSSLSVLFQTNTDKLARTATASPRPKSHARVISSDYSVLDLLVSSNDHRGSISMSLHQACGDEKDLTDLLQVPTKLQRKLTQEDTGAEISSMIETASCMRDEARLRSVGGRSMAECYTQLK